MDSGKGCTPSAHLLLEITQKDLPLPAQLEMGHQTLKASLKFSKSLGIDRVWKDGASWWEPSLASQKPVHPTQLSLCDTVIYNTYVFGLHLFLARAGISRVLRFSRCPLDGSWLPGEPTTRLGRSELSATPDLWGRGTDWANHQRPRILINPAMRGASLKSRRMGLVN